MCVAIGTGFMTSAILSSCKLPLNVLKTTSKDNIVTIPASEFDLADYKIIRVSNYDYDFAIQKNKDGTYCTLLLMCTHAQNPLTKTGNTYYCTNHGSQFTHEGIVTKGPAERNLIQLKTTVENGQIYIYLIKT